jgi:hypothetical protein
VPIGFHQHQALIAASDVDFDCPMLFDDEFAADVIV